MNRYYVTMGVQYRHEPHPMIPMGLAHPDGYLVVEAEDELQALDKVSAVLGNHYAFLYREDEFEASWHPLGCLGEIQHGVVPTEEGMVALDAG